MSEMLGKIPEFVDFGEAAKTADDEELERVYLRENNYLAVIGYKTLEDFARFTSSEDLSIDTIEYAGKDRVYFTGLKRRAVYRRASEAILREYTSDYSCATPDHQCMNCYNCYTYGGTNLVKGKTKSIRSRMKMTTSYSIQSSMDAVVDEDEFHIMVHRDLEMAQKEEGQEKGSIHTITLIKPNTVFPFIDIIFNPTKFDVAMYLETIERGDAEGYGSKGSLLGTMSTEILGIIDDLDVTHRDLLDAIKVTDDGEVDASEAKSLIDESISKKELENLKDELPDLIEKHRGKIYPDLE